MCPFKTANIKKRAASPVVTTNDPMRQRITTPSRTDNNILDNETKENKDINAINKAGADEESEYDEESEDEAIPMQSRDLAGF
jgi:hypothetical protein